MFSGGIERHQWHEMCCLFRDADTTVFEDIITYVSLISRPIYLHTETNRIPQEINKLVSRGGIIGS